MANTLFDLRTNTQREATHRRLSLVDQRLCSGTHAPAKFWFFRRFNLNENFKIHRLQEMSNSLHLEVLTLILKTLLLTGQILANLCLLVEAHYCLEKNENTMILRIQSIINSKLKKEHYKRKGGRSKERLSLSCA